jgi:hypothetical protein
MKTAPRITVDISPNAELAENAEVRRRREVHAEVRRKRRRNGMEGDYRIRGLHG